MPKRAAVASAVSAAWASASTTASTSSASVSPAPSTSPSVAPVPAPAASAPRGPNLECHAISSDGGSIDLILEWDRNVAKGTLRTTTKSGTTTEQAVQAELYKGLVLVNPSKKPAATDRIATEQTENDKKIQLGDWKQPWLPCE